jgi:hypothetical protein
MYTADYMNVSKVVKVIQLKYQICVIGVQVVCLSHCACNVLRKLILQYI